MNVQRELERFLRQQLFRERSEAITAIELRHAASGSKGNIVDDFEFGNINTDNISSLIDDVLNRAQNDANGLGGVQRYELHILAGEKKVAARFAFRIQGEDEAVDNIAGDEAANMKGLLTQLMRHNEQQNRTMMTGIGAMVQMMNRTIERDQDTIEHLLEERRKNWDIIEKGKTQEHERELELMEAHRKGEREDMMFQKINALFPLLLSKVSGKPAVDSQEKTLLAGFVDSLSEEQFQKIASALSPEQQILLFTVVKEMKQKSLPNGQS